MRRDSLPALVGWILFAFSSFVLAWPVVSYDLWWHLAAGREIAAAGAVPRFDAFSHTLSGTPWIDFEWLFQWGAFRVHQAFGPAGLVWGKALLLGLAVRIVYRTALLEGAGTGPAALAALAALGLLRTRAFVRPEIASLLLFPYFLRAVLAARRDARALPPPLLALPPLTALWANLHPGFTLGILLLPLAAAGSWLRDGASGRPFARAALWTAAACAAAALANPYGAGVYRAVWIHAQGLLSTGGMAAIAEWRALSIDERPVYWALLAAAFAAAAVGTLREDPEARFWTPLIVVLGIWASREVRNPVYFAFAAAPYLAARLSRGRGEVWEAARTAAPAAALLIAAALAAPAAERTPGRWVRWELFPRSAAAFMRERGVGGRVFNTYEFGGFLEWELGDSIRTFYDGRYIFHDLLGRVGEALEDPAAFGALLRERGVDAAVVRHRALGDRSLWETRLPREEWALVYWDDAASVFLRRAGGNAAVIREGEYLLTDPGSFASAVARVRSGELSRERILAELARRDARHGPCVISGFLAETLRAL